MAGRILSGRRGRKKKPLLFRSAKNKELRWGGLARRKKGWERHVHWGNVEVEWWEDGKGW